MEDSGKEINIFLSMDIIDILVYIVYSIHLKIKDY